MDGPDIHLNWLAILASVVASFAIGGIWYGPLFGKAWARSLGWAEGVRPSGKEIARGSVLNVIGIFLMAFVLAHDVLGWRPSAWHAGTDGTPAIYGFFAAFFAWLGFIVPMILNAVGYERKSLKFALITGGYQLISLITMGMILTYWR